ncbi:MAG: sigma-70 family RNA polymerase sigma factor [Methanobacteriota archaeon]|nr:MAG: sigma-70 family RNA polymerase sigma factor [Euryarchaeota archaeon]
MPCHTPPPSWSGMTPSRAPGRSAEEPSSDRSHDPCRRIGPSVGVCGAKNWTGGPGRMTTGTMLRCEERPMRSSAVGWDVDRGITGTDQEATLLARIARRDATAFETLYDRYSRAVYSLALRMLGNPQAAQEVAQEIFLHIWRGAGEFIPARGSARSWVLSLAHHRSVDALRRQRVRTVEPLAEGDRSEGGGADVVEQVLRGVEGATVRSALMTLSAEQREAIVLAYYGGYTQQEIANRLKIPLGTVKTRIRDGMQRLRVQLVQEEEGRQ